MNRSLIMPLVLKDWYLHRGTMKMALIGGLVSLGLLLVGGLAAVFGLAATFACTIILGIGLSQSTVMNERNKQNEPFVMSLPITPLEYAAAKILANVSMFSVVWLVLMFGLYYLFLARGLPGFLPPITVLAVAIFVGYCIMLSVGIVVRSERLWILAMTATNFAYGGVWLALTKVPDLLAQALGKTAVWSGHILSFLGVELLVLFAALAVGAYGQSRKTSFL